MKKSNVTPIVKAVLVLSMAILFSTGCSTGQTGETSVKGGNVPAFKMKDAREVLKSVKKFNDDAPDSVRAYLNVSGALKREKFRVIGRYRYSRKDDKLLMRFRDFVFRSPVGGFFRDGSVYHFHLPLERKVYIYKKSRPPLKQYLSCSLDLSMLQQVVEGRIPLLQKYSVHNCAHCENSMNSMLVLQNNSWYETINMRRGMPFRILFIQKATGNRVEIYFKGFHWQGRTCFFSSIRLMEKTTGIDVVINSSKVRLNGKVRIRGLHLPGGTAEIHL